MSIRIGLPVELVAETKRYTLLGWADFAETLSRAEGKADLVFTSPPYDDARTYGNAVSWKMRDYHRLGESILDALRPGGHCLMVLDSPVREWRKGMGTERGFTPWKVMLDWAEMGFRVPDRLAYGRMGHPGAFPGRLRNDWEPLLWFQKPGDGFFSVPSTRTGKDWTKKLSWTRNKDGSVERHAPNLQTLGMKNYGTLWDYGALGASEIRGETGGRPGGGPGGGTDHPAPFSKRLASDVIRCFCPPDGLVVDPFLGSGTSLVAAIKHGRRFLGGDLYGNEKSISWSMVALDRLSRDRSIQHNDRPERVLVNKLDQGLFA